MRHKMIMRRRPWRRCLCTRGRSGCRAESGERKAARGRYWRVFAKVLQERPSSASRSVVALPPRVEQGLVLAHGRVRSGSKSKSAVREGFTKRQSSDMSTAAAESSSQRQVSPELGRIEARAFTTRRCCVCASCAPPDEAARAVCWERQCRSVQKPRPSVPFRVLQDPLLEPREDSGPVSDASRVDVELQGSRATVTLRVENLARRPSDDNPSSLPAASQTSSSPSLSQSSRSAARFPGPTVAGPLDLPSRASPAPSSDLPAPRRRRTEPASASNLSPLRCRCLTTLPRRSRSCVRTAWKASDWRTSG